MTRLRISLLLLGCGLLTQAHGETTPYYIGVSQSLAHDSNLLRLSDGQAVPEGFTKSDNILTTSLLAGFDQPIGRQRVFGNLTVGNNRLQHNDVYDNQSYALVAGAEFETAGRLSGSLTGRANQNLGEFNTEELGLVTEKNVENTQQIDGALRLGMMTVWSAEALFGARSVDYTAEQFQTREFRQKNLSLGVRYQPSSYSNYGIALREANGRYPHFRTLPDGTKEADTFNQQNIDFTAYVAPSAVSNVYARLSYGHTDYDVATQRNFSGLTGLLKWVWNATGKLRFDTRLTRDPGQDSYFLAQGIADDTVDYSRVTTAVRVRADYDVTAKIALNTSLTYSHRQLTQTVGGSQVDGTDSSTDIVFGATWVPVRTVTLGCNAVHDRRRGEAPLSSNLTETTVSCYGQFMLQL